MRSPVSMKVMQPGHRLIRLPHFYQLRAHGRLGWLHRALWRALHKLDALEHPEVEETHYVAVVIDADRVMERIWQANVEAFSALGRRPTQVLIGPDDIAELMQDDTFKRLSMAPPTRIIGKIGFDREVFGLPITIVPHMQGVLVL